MSANHELCFVIMPISKTSEIHTCEYWAKHYEDFLRPLIEENTNVEAKRSEALRGDILKQIITDLVTSRIVVADLTDHNSNVYWELGVRQSFKHGTVTIAEEGTKLPFDIGGKGTLFYDPVNHLKIEDFRKRFKGAIEDCLKYPDRPDSQVLETISGRGTLFEILRREEAIRRLDAVLSECDNNLLVLERSLSRSKQNQGNPKNREFITSRPRMSAAELLITNRYIDEEVPFFHLAEKYFDRINGLNDQLNLWEKAPGSTEKWIIASYDIYLKLINDFRKNIISARDKLTKRF